MHVMILECSNSGVFNETQMETGSSVGASNLR
ncbi:Uncharacterised protein [Mycobacteroides abscessus subsp. abscessus]|nr:Uncharacterised protein [Mycobacteroides abscessus subsp. abscessus]